MQQPEGIDVLALVKPTGEKYIFMYDAARLTSLLQRLGQFASNPDLSFTWYDAAALSMKARRQAEADQQPKGRT